MRLTVRDGWNRARHIARFNAWQDRVADYPELIVVRYVQGDCQAFIDGIKAFDIARRKGL